MAGDRHGGGRRIAIGFAALNEKIYHDKRLKVVKKSLFLMDFCDFVRGVGDNRAAMVGTVSAGGA